MSKSSSLLILREAAGSTRLEELAEAFRLEYTDRWRGTAVVMSYVTWLKGSCYKYRCRNEFEIEISEAVFSTESCIAVTKWS